MNEALSRLLRQEDTVLFIGSGLSAWSKLPSWAGLLEKIADHLDGLGQDTTEMRRHIATDPVRAADYALGPGRMAPESLGRFLREDCQFGAAQPHDIHHRIVTLGARCFVTTNYDHLLESALRAEYSGRPPLVVKNNQPIEIAEIIGARSQNFVYKLHGDIDDSASLILARTQYRDLFENGDRKYALEALRTLSQTRPVVYIGFGLRDLDFLLVQDELRNLWKGAPREHYAILPDASPTDIADWLHNYGIRVVSYATVERADGSRDHAPLLALLDELRVPAAPAAAPVAGATPDSSATRLALLRYANGLADVPAVSPELPLRVHASQRHRGEAYRYDSAMLQQFLDEGPERAVLIGLPGAGKTYALRQAAARAARRLREADQADAFDAATVVPLLADFKNYEGSLQLLLEKNLPGSLSLAGLAGSYRLLILLDSFNEMPREQWERETHEADVAAFLKQFPTARIIISSRTEEGLSKLNLPTFTIDEIESSFLREELQRRALDLSGRFATELFALLGKPFFFQLVARNKVTLPAEPRPRDIYESYFKALTTRFTDRFGVTFDLARALCSAAYEAINSGQEAMPAETLAQALRRNLQGAGLTTPTPDEVLNWLISEDVLLTYSGRRVAFFHQSVTEYLAATELARRYIATPQILLDKLAFTRWDQALFLTLSLLPEAKATPFLNQVLAADFELAIRAAKYLETGRDQVVTTILEHLVAGNDDEWYRGLWQIPISDSHEKLLHQLFRKDGESATHAANFLVQLCGERMKNEFMQMLCEQTEDEPYSEMVTAAASSLSSLINLDDIELLVSTVEAAYLRHLETKQSHSFRLNSGYGLSMRAIPLKEVAAIVLAPHRNPVTLRVRAQLMDSVVVYLGPSSKHTNAEEIFSVGRSLLLKGESTGLDLLYRVDNTSKATPMLWAAFDQTDINRFCQYLPTQSGTAALDCLRNLYEARLDLRPAIIETVAQLAGNYRLFALAALDDNYQTEVFSVLQDACTQSNEARALLPVSLLEVVHLNWRGREQLFVDLIQLRDALFLTELPTHYFTPFAGESMPVGLSHGTLPPWLTWLKELSQVKFDNGGYWFYKLSNILSSSLNPVFKQSFLLELNQPASPHRGVLAALMSAWNITTDDFSDETVAFLLSQLGSRAKSKGPFLQLLGRTVTEAFIQDKLLPLRRSKSKTLQADLAAVLTGAGQRHRRRYLLPTTVT